jgi:hypothetical protein
MIGFKGGFFKEEFLCNQDSDLSIQESWRDPRLIYMNMIELFQAQLFDSVA